MQKQEKSRKPLIVGIIAAVLILAVLLVVLLTQCTGGAGDQDGNPSTSATVPSSSEEQEVGYQLYWNLDKAEYAGKSEAGLSSREPGADGIFQVRLFCDGEEITVKVKDRQFINTIDSQDIVGLEFDADGFVSKVLNLDEMPLQKAGWQFYVQSAARTVVKVNSAENMNGMEIMLEKINPDHIWDMTGVSGPVGCVTTLAKYDKVMAVQNEKGETTHIFVYDRSKYMKTHVAHCQHCDEDVIWYEWVDNLVAPNVTGHFQLHTDIQLSKSTEMAEGTELCLDLNGHRIDAAENRRVYIMRNAATIFAVMDTSEGQTGIMAAHGKTDQGAVVWPYVGSLYIYGGTFDASDAFTYKNGPALSVSKVAKVYMYGGKIIGGTTMPLQDPETKKFSGGYAGAIYVQGKFYMDDGVIENGRSQSVITYSNGNPTYNVGYGGNIRVAATGEFVMNGGIIRNGKSDSYGGNIYTSGVFTMNGGSIQGGICYGKGRNGGNIYLGSTGVFTMNGGSIVGGVSYNAGGNVYNAGEFIMNSGYIGAGALMDFETGKRTSGDTYNMYVVNGKLTLWGGTILGGIKMYDSKVDDGKQAELNLYGWAKVTGGEDNKNLYIDNLKGDGIAVNVGTLKDGADIHVNASGIFTKPTKKENLKYFHSDVEGLDVVYYQECLALGKESCICGASSTVTPNDHDEGCDGTMQFWSPWSSATSLPTASGYYYLTKDVTTAGQTTISEGNDVKLDLNGHNVTLEVPTSLVDGFRVYRADYGAKLAITDTTAKATGMPGTIKTVMPAAGSLYTGTGSNQSIADAAWAAGNNGMLLWASGGEISVHNGILDGSNLNGTKEGMVIYCAYKTINDKRVYGTVNIYGGTVIGGNTTSSGNIYALGTLNIYGGLIKNGIAKNGGNIVAKSTGALNIYGGTITGGTASAEGANVYVDGPFTMSGGAIHGGVCVAGAGANLAGDVVINKSLTAADVAAPDYSLKIAGENTVDLKGLGANFEIYVTAAGKFATNANEAIKNQLKSEFAGAAIVLDGTDLYCKYVEMERCLCGVDSDKAEDHTDGCDGTKYTWKPWESDTTLPIATGNYYLIQSVNLEENVTPEKGAVIRLDLLGNDINLEGKENEKTDEKLYLLPKKNDNHIVLTDSSVGAKGKVVITGTVAGDGGILEVNSTNHFELYRATLDATQATTEENGAVAAVREGEFTIHSGTLLGGTAVKHGGVFRIFPKSTVTMNGGRIVGGTAVCGGAVAVYGGSFTMNDGIVEGGNAVLKDGKTNGEGGVFYVHDNRAKLTINGGIVRNGTAAATGGCIWANGGQTTITNAIITGGQAPIGGGIYLANSTSAKLNVGGSTTITGNTSDGTDANNLYAEAKAVVKINSGFTGTISLNGGLNDPIISGVTSESHAYIQGKNIVIDDPIVYQFMYSASGVGVEFAPPKPRMQCICGGKLPEIEGVHKHQDVEFMSWTDSKTLPTTPGNYYLLRDIELTQTMVINTDGVINLDLNGMSVVNKSGSVFNVKKGTLAITDSQSQGNIAGKAEKGGAILAEGTGIVHFYGGSVSGSEASLNGAGVYLKDSAKLVVGGTADISKNTLSGGTDTNNVYVETGASIEIMAGFTGKIGLAGALNAVVIPGITDENNAFITNGNVFVDDTENFKATITSEGLKVTLFDEAYKYQCVCAGKLEEGQYGHKHEYLIFKPWDGDSLPTASGNYYLTKDVKLTSTPNVIGGTEICLDLCGNTISNNTNGVAKLYMTYTRSNIKLIVTDSVGGGQLVTATIADGGNGGILDVGPDSVFEAYNITMDASGYVSRENGAVACIRAGAELVTYNCIIKGGTAGTSAATAKNSSVFRMFNGSTVIVNGGVIYGGKATASGGIIYSNNIDDVENPNTIILRDVVVDGGIAGCYGGADKNGGAILAFGYTDVILDSVEIKNCSVNETSIGGAVIVSGKSTLTIAGNTIITENTKNGVKNNIHCRDGAKVTIGVDFTGKVSFDAGASTGTTNNLGMGMIQNIADLNHAFITEGKIVLDNPEAYAFAVYDGNLGFKAK